MDIPITSTQQLIDQACRFSTFTGLTRSNPQDRFFLVMGQTGSGKSTFVARCTGRDLTVGHGLYSCTSLPPNQSTYPSNGSRGTTSIDTYSYTLPYRRGIRTIHLIDTPGFNDTARSDIDTLSVLASYLGASYANGVRIHGIVLLHPITDNRMSRSSVRNVEIMEKICGFTSYENVAVATTMWARSDSGAGRSPHERGMLEQREIELQGERRFLGGLAVKGAVMFRHGDSGVREILSKEEEKRSAQRIVAYLIAQSDAVGSAPKVLRLQREIIDEGKTLGETEAGRVVAGELYNARRDHEWQLRDVETEMKGRLARADAAELQDLKTDIERKLAKTEEEKKGLRNSMREMHEEEERAWKTKIEEVDEQLRELIAKKEEVLEELKESIREIRADASLSRWSVQAKMEVSDHKIIIRNVRREVVEARDMHAKLRGQIGNITNGLANGIAAGVVTSVVTGGKPLSNSHSVW